MAPSHVKPAIKHRLLDEAKNLTMVFVYLALLLGGFTTYRRLVLAEQGIAYLQYGYGLIEALVLAKVILMGDLLHVGERYRHKPLIVPILYKTFSTSLLVLAFTVGEHVVVGFFEGKTLGASLHAITSQGRYEILARTVMMFVAFIPLFAIREVGCALGRNDLFDLFFKRRPEGMQNQPSKPQSP